MVYLRRFLVGVLRSPPMSVEVRSCMRGGGRSKFYGYGPHSRIKVISLEGENVDSARRVEKQSAEYLPLYGIRQRFVLFRNQNMTVSCGPSFGF